MSKVKILETVTTQDIPCDRILKAWKGQLTGLILAGWDHEGELICCSSYGSIPEALYLVEKYRQKLLEMGAEE